MHQRPGGPIALVLYVVAIVGELYNLFYFIFVSIWTFPYFLNKIHKSNSSVEIEEVFLL